MPDKNAKVTVIVRSIGGAWRTWEASMGQTDLVFVDSPAFLPHAIEQSMNVHQHDVVRVIIDRVGTPAQFLQVLSSVPRAFLGDILFIRADGDSFLSALARGGDRVLYKLTSADVTFYLKTMKLIGEEIDEGSVRDAKSSSPTE